MHSMHCLLLHVKYQIMKVIKKSKEHLEETNWSYWQHLRHSIKQSNRLITLAIKSYLHGLMPWIFPSSGPVGIYRIYKEIKKLHHVQKIFAREDSKND